MLETVLSPLHVSGADGSQWIPSTKLPQCLYKRTHPTGSVLQRTLETPAFKRSANWEKGFLGAHWMHRSVGKNIWSLSTSCSHSCKFKK